MYTYVSTRVHQCLSLLPQTSGHEHFLVNRYLPVNTFVCKYVCVFQQPLEGSSFGKDDPSIPSTLGPRLSMWALDDRNELLTPCAVTLFKRLSLETVFFQSLHNNLYEYETCPYLVQRVR